MNDFGGVQKVEGPFGETEKVLAEVFVQLFGPHDIKRARRKLTFLMTKKKNPVLRDEETFEIVRGGSQQSSFQFKFFDKPTYTVFFDSDGQPFVRKYARAGQIDWEAVRQIKVPDLC